ncbi:MAG: hypothetical protein Q9195_005783 [Heterodermia aff. obscurata]
MISHRIIAFLVISPKPDHSTLMTRGGRIWLYDLSDSLPRSARLHGFDISSSQYSPPEWIPSNVSLHVGNALEDPLPIFRGVFDVVHSPQHFSTGTIAAEAKIRAAPGGYLVLEEIDSHGTKIVQTEESKPAVALNEELAEMKAHRELRSASSLSLAPQYSFPNNTANPSCSWIGELPRILHEMSFSDVSVERIDQLGWQTKMWMEQQLLVREEFTTNYLDAHGPPGEADAQRRIIREMWAEVQQGSTLGVCLQTVVGRKPIDL